jgi:UDP-N-acetylmuramoylalanine--D-glutamate ligase
MQAIIAEDNPDIMVLEISVVFSWMTSTAFRPFISILLNITPDHLDRYDYSMENYAECKVSGFV